MVSPFSWGLRRSAPWLAATVGIAVSVLFPGAAAQAEPASDLRVFVQPLSGCLVSRVGNLYCQGVLSPPFAISADPAENPTLWRGIAYALCWTTPEGLTYPQGSTCTAGGSALATGHNNSYPRAATFPVTFTGSQDQGCAGWPSPEANSFLFWVANTGPCAFSIPTAVGDPAAKTSFSLTVGDAQQPTLTGTLAEQTTGTFQVGQRTPLQLVTCKINEYIGNLWVSCPGVMLNWTVISGRRSCVITTNTNKASQTVGTVSVRFRRPGRCVVEGSYPAVPGQSLAFRTAKYTFTVTPKR
ncbi:MAG: hypothetical protein KGN78_09310 [Actinomycetales bacterium]|nr:hypothetical protein [Actinomycetales bacterium]